MRYLAAIFAAVLAVGCRGAAPSGAPDGGDGALFGATSTIPIKQLQAPAGSGVPTTSSASWNANATTCTDSQVAICNGTSLAFSTLSGSCTIGNTGVISCTTINPSTTLTAGFTQPAIGSTIDAGITSTAGMFTGEFLFVNTGGYYTVSSVTNSTAAVLKNIGDNVNAVVDAGVTDGSTVFNAGRPKTVATSSFSGSATTTSTSYAGLSTGTPAVTVVTGTSAVVTISCMILDNSTTFGFISFAVSGATTVAGADSNGAGADLPANTNRIWSRTVQITGLTAGTNTFTFNARVGGGTATFSDADISVVVN